MARRTPRERIEAELVACFAGSGFRLREDVWVRDRGAMQDWAVLEPHESRWEPLSFDAVVGVRVDPVERLLAQILGTRSRRRVPTYVRQLSRLHFEGTPGIRVGGARWPFPSTVLKEPARVIADFGRAFETSAVPFLDRLTDFDALAAVMTEGRVDGETAYRLPVLHLLRADAAAAREVLEQGTRWMSGAGNVGAYRTFALEVVRRLGDAQLEETPCEELVNALRPALRDAFPDRAAIILAALVRSFWWEAHPRTGDVTHCAFCGTTEVEAQLFGRRSRQICDTCVSASFVLFEDPRSAGATRIERPIETSGPFRGRPGYARVAANPGAVSAANLAADAVRALRGTLEDADRYVASVERRLLAAPADRDAASVCVACGPILRGRTPGYEWNCSFCNAFLYEEPSVDAGRASICEGCVREMHEEVDASRRLV